MHRGGRSLVVYTDDMGGVWPTSCRVGSDCLVGLLFICAYEFSWN